MKTYISFVIQGITGHKHYSEVLETRSPSYSYSANPPIDEVKRWAERKQDGLNKEETLVITGMFKL